jgi:hypothetical protein
LAASFPVAPVDEALKLLGYMSSLRVTASAFPVAPVDEAFPVAPVDEALSYSYA